MNFRTRYSYSPRGARVVVALIAMACSASIGRAAEPPGSVDKSVQYLRVVNESVPHVRAVDAKLAGLIAEGARRSPLFRTLVDRLNQSTVIVYVQPRVLTSDLSGRLTFIGRSEPWRYLRVEIECRQATDNQIAALGHELQHAVEIANQEAAVDPMSIRALYGTIGFALDNTRRRFESDAAKDAGRRVRKELSIPIQTISYELP